MLIGTLIDSVILSVYGGNPSDDVSLSRAQIQLWLQTTRDTIAKALLDKQIQEGKGIDSLYMIRETYKLPTRDTVTDVNDEDERIYFTLNKRPMSLYKDSGVVKVITDDNQPVLKTTVERVEVINDLKYAKPSAYNLVYYRTGNDINILGLNSSNLSLTSFEVYYIPALAAQTLTEADDILLQDDLIPSLLDLVEDTARRELFGIQDRENDGTSPEPQRQSTDWRMIQNEQQ